MLYKLFKRFYQKKHDERGSVLIMVSLGLVALLGCSALVMDYGVVALERRRLVTAADAAALAGAQELIRNAAFPALAQACAVAYAEWNGVDPHKVTASVLPELGEIVVQVENGVEFIFARIFGKTGANVTARARAIAGPVAGIRGLAPFSVIEQPLQFGVKYSLKYSEWKETGLEPGSYGALALGGTGASRYRENIKKGYSQLISIGDELDTEQGNMSGPTAQGIGDLIGANCGCTLENFQPGCPLLVYIPVIRYLADKKKVKVVSFAAFFIDKNNPPKPGNENIVTGTFVEIMSTGPVDRSITPYGIYAVNLVE
ncbi:MAG: pilus assembly protein TadG-related protein [Bacillota bacterium]